MCTLDSHTSHKEMMFLCQLLANLTMKSVRFKTFSEFEPRYISSKAYCVPCHTDLTMMKAWEKLHKVAKRHKEVLDYQVLMGNFHFINNVASGLLFEKQREIYSDRISRLQVRFQTPILWSLCSFYHSKPPHFQLDILQLVLDLGEKGEGKCSERGGFLYNHFLLWNELWFEISTCIF